MSNQKYEQGLALAKRVIGPALTQKLLDDFVDVCPDMSRIVVENVWADLFDRPGVDVKIRELAAISSLATQGNNAVPQLKAHINGALNIGCTPLEITEILLQLSGLAGVPTAMNALTVAKEVFQSRGIKATEPVAK